MSAGASVAARFHIWFLVVALLVISAAASSIGGETMDEAIHLLGLREILKFAAGVLGGDRDLDYREIQLDLEHYGTLPVLPGFLTLRVALLFGADFPLYTEAYRLTLRTCAMAWTIGAAWMTFKIVLLIRGSRALAWLTVYALMLYPVWLGYSFFNYKDIPVAFLFSLAIYAALLAVDEQNFGRAVLLLSIATIGVCAVKIAGAALVLPSWLVVGCFALRSPEARHRILHLGLAGVVVALIVLVLTPPSWLAPIDYIIDNLTYFSRHGWNGCTLSAQRCLQPGSPDWSALEYLVLWGVAQIPIVGLLLIVPVVGFAIYLGDIRERLLLTLSAIPLLLIIWRNSTLYDGLRHLLFIFPPLFTLVFCVSHHAIAVLQSASSRTLATRALLSIYVVTLGVFVLDNILLFPYNYAYRNSIARVQASPDAYETDYWEFSIREARRLADVGARNVGGSHTYRPCHGRRARIDTPTIELERLLIRECPTQLPPECDAIGTVRRTPFLGQPLIMSSVMRCQADAEDHSRVKG